MSKYIVSPEARADLNEIWDYIAQDDFDAADRWIRTLRDSIELLARVPGMGHTRKDLTDCPVLFWPWARIWFFIASRTIASKSSPSLTVHATFLPF